MIVCVSRLVPRKGQDILIRAMPVVRRRLPDAALLLVGSGPHQSTLEGLAAEFGVAPHVVFTGPVPWSELPAHYAAGDVFAMPCRTRRGGLDVEGLGIVYLEASATGLPVVAGDSGGAPDAVREGETGFVVGGRDVGAVADRLVTLLADPALAAPDGCRRPGLGRVRVALGPAGRPAGRPARPGSDQVEVGVPPIVRNSFRSGLAGREPTADVVLPSVRPSR